MIAAILIGMPFYVMYTTINVSNTIDNPVIQTNIGMDENAETVSLSMEEDTILPVLLEDILYPYWTSMYISEPINIGYEVYDNSIFLEPNENWFGQENIYIQATYSYEFIPSPPVNNPDMTSAMDSSSSTQPISDNSEINSLEYWILTKIISVNVTAVNDPPTLLDTLPLSFQMTTGSVFDIWDQVSVNDYFEDIDSEQLTYTIIENNTQVSLEMMNNDFYSLISNDNLGSGNFTVVASDGEYNTSVNFDIEVVSRNHYTMMEDEVSEESIESFLVPCDEYEIYGSEKVNIDLLEVPGESPSVQFTPEQDWFGHDSFYLMTYSEAPIPISLNSVDTYGWYEWDFYVNNVNDQPTINGDDVLKIKMTSNSDFDIGYNLDLSDQFNDIDSSLIYSWNVESDLVKPVILNGYLKSISTTDVTGNGTLSIIGYDGEYAVLYNIAVSIVPRKSLSMEEDSTIGLDIAQYVDSVTNVNTLSSSEHIFVESSTNETLIPDADWFGLETVMLSSYPIINSVNPPLQNLNINSAVSNPGIDPPEPTVMNYTCFEFDVNVTSVNDSPTMISVPAFEMNEDAASTPVLNVNDYFDDIDSELDFSVVCHGSLVEFTLAENGLLSVTPSENWFGTEELELSATDGEFPQLQIMNINVLPVDDPPYALAEGETIALDEDTSITLNLDDYIADIDSALWFSCMMDENNAALELNETTWEATITPKENWNGVLELVVYGSDSNDQLARNLTLNVNAINDLPTAAFIQEITVKEDSAIQIDLSSYFEDIDSNLIFMASSYSGKTNTLINSSILSVSSSVDNWNGEDSLKITVSDGEYLIETDIDIVVSPVNDAPVARSTSQEMTIDEDKAITLSLSDMFSDVDGDSLSFSFDSSEYFDMQYDAITNMLTVSPLANWNGESNFQITASDDVLAAVTEIQMHVQPINDYPLQTEIMNPLILRSGSTYDIDVSSFFSDVEGSTLEFTILEGEGIAVIPLGDGVFQVTVPQNWEGVETLTIQASDGLNAIESKLTVSASMPQMIEQSASTSSGLTQSMFWAGVTAIVCFAVFAVYNTTREPRIKDQENIL